MFSFATAKIKPKNHTLTHTTTTITKRSPGIVLEDKQKRVSPIA